MYWCHNTIGNFAHVYFIEFLHEYLKNILNTSLVWPCVEKFDFFTLSQLLKEKSVL